MSPLIVRMPQLVAIVGLSPATIYRMVTAKRFPAPVRIGLRASGWKMDDVEIWQKSLQPGASV